MGSQKQNERNFKASAHYYCGMMGEAIHAMVHSHRLKRESIEMQKAGNDTHVTAHILSEAGIFARYAFLVGCNAFENSAHTLLANSGKLSSSLVEEVDRLTTINKFELFALINGKTVNRGDDRYAKAKQVVKCRNNFVHPKGIFVPIQSNPHRAEPRSVGNREYPLAFDFLEVEHAAAMIGDILQFVAWVIFDVCQFSLEDGANLVNRGMKWWTMDFHDAQTIWKYDLRSLGDFRDITVRTIVLPQQRRRPAKRKK